MDDDQQVITVRQSRAQRDGLFGFLTALVAAALVRGLIGAATTSGRIAVGVIFGVLVVVLLSGWYRIIARHAHLEISATRIRYVDNAKQPRPEIEAARGTELVWAVTRHSLYSISTNLQQPSTGTVVSLSLFDRKAVAAACADRGWQLAVRSGR